jgi:hypothetical protein
MAPAIVPAWASARPAAPGGTRATDTAPDQQQRETEALMRKLFIEVERAHRLPDAARTGAIPRLYREVYPELLKRGYHVRAFHGRLSLRGLTPEQAADTVAGEQGAPSLWFHARRRIIELFEQERTALLPLIREDLAIPDERAVRNALQLAGTIGGGDLFESVLRVFHTQPDLADQAVAAFRRIRDPRAIRVLLSADPARPLLYFEALRTLQRDCPADAALTRLLRSPDAELRWRAAYALAESGDSALVPLAETLAGDVDPRVREHAAAMLAAARRTPHP